MNKPLPHTLYWRCAVTNCAGSIYTKEWCSKHYYNQLKRGDPLKEGLVVASKGRPHYTRWANIKSRCYNVNLPAYKNYGGRGITLYAPWHSYKQFLIDLISEIGNPPTLLHTLDRIDNDGNYEPGNIRWATRVEQAENQRIR